MFVSWLSYRFPRSRRVRQGEPIIVVQDGEVIVRNLQRERSTPEEIAEAERQQKIPTGADPQWAVLETTGRISFIPKS